MSKRTRAALRNPMHLSADIIQRKPVLPDTGLTGVAPSRCWNVWEPQNSVPLSTATEEAQPKETKDLVRLQWQLTGHFLQLLGLERRLFASAQRQRGNGGRKAFRQVEMERLRLGRELHTGVGQMLAAIRLQLEVVSTELTSPPPIVAQALDNINTLTADTLEQVRDISKRLHPPEWQRLALVSAVHQLWEISGVPQRFQASLKIDPLPWEPALEVKILIYRGLQEALSNLVRHAQATRIAVTLGAQESQLVLAIVDNGVGFDAQRVFSAPARVDSGIGLRFIRETAQELGGKLQVESGPEGTRLVVSVLPFPVES